MINKIQKYLLLHYPILWNTRIVPMLLILTGVHIIFFAIGYLSADTAFTRNYYYSLDNDLGLLYFTSILVGVLILIGWLVFYSRNNGFKTFYPRRTSQLYAEWLIILAITVGLSFIPFTLTKGHIFKWKSAASLEEVKEALKTLDMANGLIANDHDYFKFENEYDKPIPIPDNMKLDPEKLDLNLYATEYSHRGGIILKGYIGPSFLFGKDRYYYNAYFYGNFRDMDSDKRQSVERQELVKKWLRNGQKDDILAVMKDFDKLQQKHNLKGNITPEQWFKRIYNPPFFEVNPSTALNSYKPEYYYDEDDYSQYPVEEAVVVAAPVPDSTYQEYAYSIVNSKTPYLQYSMLRAGYEHILQYYEYDNAFFEWFILFCSCIAVCLSIFVYTFRVTGGKQWLIAFVALGILIFIVVLLGVALAQSVGYRSDRPIAIGICLFWIALFIALLIRIIAKITSKGRKGRSSIYMNILIWLLPCLIPLSYLTVFLHSEYSDEEYFEPTDADVMNMFWFNIIFIAVAMSLISVLVRKWKSIAEE
ncbi:hypothetical protein M2451_000835 [Dysgonomonas sp. PFB1-18]|uniref:hypothetical protein n=1 Tax=unclassified Dysgonomonas TaxID=2630389 RepID=UPI00247503BE|nr:MULTISPECIES: hypothetical protein [unclassified Dysgonomonas]MDH6308524.1 hypothetical protein [Dysgonomonas sp. PF1-14]MDH6338025.1 hypothetical protein [Dysgonomonas sp. PF1-16]MDH6379522.1 hypothetical protein [Dysgonomonas sp. PFB1-18]MDH6396852.1 hypothetical protein [Dysgonomonas sp. PF1-23]